MARTRVAARKSTAVATRRTSHTKSEYQGKQPSPASKTPPTPRKKGNGGKEKAIKHVTEGQKRKVADRSRPGLQDGRCAWAESTELRRYHDTVWGRHVHDDRLLFEHMSLQLMQAGLNWMTVLRKREAFLKAFDEFDIEKVAKYNAAKEAKLMADAGIIRNRLKIKAIISNAQVLSQMHANSERLYDLLWSVLPDRKPIVNEVRHFLDCPTTSDESVVMSKLLREKGFRFVGPTMCYTYMQVIGMIDDHVVGCMCKGTA